MKAETCCAVLSGILMIVCSVDGALAQTDYYNIDRNRPVRVEDAYSLERYAIELKPAPVRAERFADGVYRWSVEPGLTYGILPRTEVEIAASLSSLDRAGEQMEFGGVEVSVLHTVNVESRTLPALGVRAEVTVPVGAHAPDEFRPAITGMATRSFGPVRLHLNGQYTFGPSATAAEQSGSGGHGNRWLGGAGLDRAFALQSLLVVSEVYVEQPLDRNLDPVWNAGGGFRYQVSPLLIVDAGIGRRMTGSTAWFGTLGAAMHFARVPSTRGRR